MNMLQPLFFGLLFYLSWVAFSVNSQITKTAFSCDGRVSGYYADVGAGCQVYHMCDGLGRKFSFVCPNATLFQQRMLICDHWFMVNCSRSERDYGANLLIGQKEKPFVGESGGTSFQRTPRPDYATGDAEKDAIYENKVEPNEDVNLVGVSSDENQTNTKYNLPSRWSTEYNKISPTVESRQQINRRRDSQSSQPTLEDRLNHNTIRRIDKQPEIEDKRTTQTGEENTKVSFQSNPAVRVNFESRFKATTPVYPKFVEESLKFNGLELAPPKLTPDISSIEEINNLQSRETSAPSIPINFESRFKATTPVYPTFVDDALKLNDLELSPPAQKKADNDLNSEINKNEGKSKIKVNFESNFKATTPVYPTSVDDALKTNNFELFPPESGDANSKREEVKVNFVSNYEATTPVYPLSVESTSPLPDKIGLLPPHEDFPKRINEVSETSTRIPVNFESNFLATVPNYPISVEATSPVPEDIGLLPPLRSDPTGRFLNFEPQDYSNSNEERQQQEPSQNYEPPLFGTGYVDPNGALVRHNPDSTHVLSPKIEDWNELRRRFSVPDYDFPLDSGVRRVGYESELNSFQPRPSGLQQR